MHCIVGFLVVAYFPKFYLKSNSGHLSEDIFIYIYTDVFIHKDDVSASSASDAL